MFKTIVSSRLLRRTARLVFLCLALTAASSATAQAPTVRDAWIRGTATGQRVTGAYMIIESPISAFITGAHSPRAERVELRTMEIADRGPLQAKISERFTVSAGESLRLSPLTDHLMLIGIKQPLQVGERVPLILEYRLTDGRRGEIAVEAAVHPFYAKPGP